MAPRSTTGPGPHRHHDRWRRDLLIALVILLALAVAGPAEAGGRRWWRRRGRRSADGATLAVGAWLELVDTLESVGLPITVHATSTEIVAAATALFGEDLLLGATDIAVTAERALCSPDRPPDLPTAATAWALQRRIDRRLRRSLPTRQRLRALARVGHQPRRPLAAGPGARRRHRTNLTRSQAS